jgi:hypothetical protein
MPDSFFQFIEAGVQLAEQSLPFFYAQKWQELRAAPRVADAATLF